MKTRSRAEAFLFARKLSQTKGIQDLGLKILSEAGEDEIAELEETSEPVEDAGSRQSYLPTRKQLHAACLLVILLCACAVGVWHCPIVTECKNSNRDNAQDCVHGEPPYPQSVHLSVSMKLYLKGKNRLEILVQNSWSVTHQFGRHSAKTSGQSRQHDNEKETRQDDRKTLKSN
ncbi:uncharacterized protein LOC134181631 [Corticium candelabrum]|uniref:uncharacterized protein LOC134181631 n=1 Tax=Corticium candelabrum TaxID=121492 RepID=UPI002E25BD13|nr:uncharacterized protein LOC134181631 [Corticium candelabrum]